MKAAVVKFSINTNKIMNIIGIVDDIQECDMNYTQREKHDNVLAMCNISKCNSFEEFMICYTTCKNICKYNEHASRYLRENLSLSTDFETYKLCRDSFCALIENDKGCKYELISCNEPKITDDIIAFLKFLGQ